MNDEIVYALIDVELQRLRALPYGALASMVNSNEAKDVCGKTAEDIS